MRLLRFLRYLLFQHPIRVNLHRASEAKLWCMGNLRAHLRRKEEVCAGYSTGTSGKSVPSQMRMPRIMHTMWPKDHL